MSLAGASYLVLGATGGIGSETCRRLRDAGAQVMLGARDPARLEALSQQLDAPGRSLDARSCDEVERVVKEASEHFGTLSGVVNCVGSVLLKPAHLTTVAEWEETLALNLTSAFATVRAAATAMKRQGGSIVLVSSAAAQTGLANHEAIAAAKAGVAGLTRSAAASYAGRNIRVNAVAPGLVRTGMTRRIWENEKSAEMSRGMHALGRLGEPSDVASLIVWLLDPANTWITGQLIGVDGGLSTLHPTRSNR